MGHVGGMGLIALQGHSELVEGQVGKAVRFTFNQDDRNAFFTGNLRGSAKEDCPAGMPFGGQGDDPDACAGLQPIDDDNLLRCVFFFPSKNAE
jgi:hypothetical protein